MFLPFWVLFLFFPCSRDASTRLDKYEIILISCSVVFVCSTKAFQGCLSQKKVLLLLIRMKAEGYWRAAVSTVQCRARGLCVCLLTQSET